MSTPTDRERIDDILDDYNSNPERIAAALLNARYLLASTARVIEAQALDLSSLAKCRRSVLTEYVGILRSVAVGYPFRHRSGRTSSEYDRLTSPSSPH